MNLSNYLTFDSPEELTSYLNELFVVAIDKIRHGSKRILIVLPVGCGKTTLLCRIAKEIASDKGKDALFIIQNLALKIQMTYKFSGDLPNAKAITFFELSKSNFEQIKDSNYLFVDDLYFRDRRELMRVLKDYQGIVVAMSGTGDQEVMGR